MPSEQKKTNPFEGLTWNDLTSWTGDKIVSRGKSYQRSGYVKELACAPDGSLIAWVEGTERYATQVFFEDENWFEEDDDLNEFDEVYRQTKAITETKFLEPFLKKHTKAQLVELIKELAGQYPLV